MSPPLETPSYAARAFLPSSTFRVADLASLRVRMHWSGSGGKTNLPMGRFFLALILFPPYSLLSSFPLVWIAFALDGIAITKDGMEGFPLYPNAALKKIGRDCERRGSRCS